MPSDILVIDDEQVIVDSIRKLCSSEGWHVDPVLDAKSGLKRLDQNTYRLIICDIMMPEMDGFMFLEEVQSRNIDTPVIITTGYSTVENAVKSLNSGAIDFLAKPFTFDELISSIKRSLRLVDIRLAQQTSGRDDEVVAYVPCPDHYKRLGYGSWAHVEEDGSVKIGVTDIMLRTLGNVEELEFFQLDDEIIQGNPCIYLQTDDQLQHAVLAPMTGRIIEDNQVLKAGKEIIEKDPYFDGWVYRIIPSSLEYEMKHLTPCSKELF